MSEPAMSSANVTWAVVNGALIILVIGMGTALFFKQWRRAGKLDPTSPSLDQTTSSSRWQLVLGVLLVVAWIFATIAFIDAALRSGGPMPLIKIAGLVPLPQWFALALRKELHNVLWSALMATAFWFALIFDKRDSATNPIRNGYCGMIWLFAFITLSASVASIWS